jgi:Tol biopolymer transport system component
LQTGSNLLVSPNLAGGVSQTGDSGAPSVSEDGRYVAFESTSTDLVDGIQDKNFRRDVFVRDIANGRTILVSSGLMTNVTADGESASALVSPNGGLVLFRTTSTALSPAGMGKGWRLFDLQTRSTRNISTNPVFFATPAESAAAFSADGAWLAFQEYVAAGSTVQGIFRYDVAAGRTELVCTNCGTPSLSADGRLLAFVRPLGVPGTSDVWVSDRVSGAVTLVSVAARGAGSGNASSTAPAISGNGRYVAFESQATNLVSESVSGLKNVFVRDLFTGQTTCLSAIPIGTFPDDRLSIQPRPSADGESIAFVSFASSLVQGDLNVSADVFLARLTHRDSDGDGMADDWETSYFGDLSHDGSADTDGDGSTDLDEFRAGTNPVDPSSSFRLTGAAVGQGGETVIRWKAAPGKVYRIEAKERLDQGAWVEVASGLVATSVQESYSVPSAASGQFFRVVVQL